MCVFCMHWLTHCQTAMLGFIRATERSQTCSRSAGLTNARSSDARWSCGSAIGRCSSDCGGTHNLCSLCLFCFRAAERRRLRRWRRGRSLAFTWTFGSALLSRTGSWMWAALSPQYDLTISLIILTTEYFFSTALFALC